MAGCYLLAANYASAKAIHTGLQRASGTENTRVPEGVVSKIRETLCFAHLQS
ncbi:hypothetical protein ALQ91_00002 [Pseudomonas syringae pv. syringae]|nr:hypothetical protein ALQ91_00002 [Pseudomonas syringae pv. syringae]